MVPVSPDPWDAVGFLTSTPLCAFRSAHTFVLLTLLPESLSPLLLFHGQDEMLWRCLAGF